MTEEDVKHLYITPALEKDGKWIAEHIGMEHQITDGQINLRGNMVARQRPKKADYLLYQDGMTPIAVVEAKDNTHSVSYGFQQAKAYAKMMDIPFAYSSNGDGFTEYDFFTGKERNFGMDDFPSENELVERRITEGKLTEAEVKAIQQPYYFSQNTYSPRYYQQVAIDRVVDAVAKGQKRLLLVMATGTGKTYTAFQIVYRLHAMGLKRKVLYLADRNILVDQSISQDFRPMEKLIHKVNFAKDDPKKITAYDIFFSLYQQMVGDDGKENFRELFKPEFFDLVIVDECHRGSAKEESRWRSVLKYFSGAVQLGMTATPKETKYVSNLDYFGEPVYTYSLKQGIEDGFLAPFRVVNVHLNIGDGWRPYKGQLDIYGQEIEDRIYNNVDFDYNIILEDRIKAVAHAITKYMKQKRLRMAKTIVFCADEAAAERMRQALAQENSDMMQKNPDYVVRITGSDTYGKDKLDYFISVSSPYPVIATTSELLSTGVDCKMVKLIVLDKNISSMTQFKQIVGRGTRLREKDGKTYFTIMDFRNVTRLFADPDWDGPINVDPDFNPGSLGPDIPGGGGDTPPVDPPLVDIMKPYVNSEGCQVFVTHETESVYDAEGNRLHVENLIDYTRTNIRNEYGDLQKFIRTWTTLQKKTAIAAELATHNIDLMALKKELHMEDVDDFDFICHVAYDQKPLTRRERAEQVKKRDFFKQYGDAAKEVLETLLDKYMNLGIREIENPSVLKLSEFHKFGTPVKIARLFGGKKGLISAIRLLENEIYKVG